MSEGLRGLLAVQGVWFASPPVVAVVDVPAQILGGKAPLLRPDYDMLAEMRADATGEAMRIIRSVQRSVEETARQERELEEATC